MSGAGTRSDGTQPFDPYVIRDSIRLTTVYATPWQCDPQQLERVARPAGEFLNLGRLASFYEVSRQQLPRVVTRQEVDPASLSLQRWKDESAVHAARIWCFTLSSYQTLVAVTLDVTATLVGSIPLLEDLYYAAIAIGGRPLEQVASEVAANRVSSAGLDGGFQPERHQLVFMAIPDGASVPDDDQIQRAIYRADLPCRPEYSSIRHPAELNRRPTTVGALGPYVSVIAGHQDYVENTVLLSAVQAVGSSARLREIRERAYECVRLFRGSRLQESNLRDRRILLEETTEVLRSLELELSFGVEATRDLGMLVPSLRVEDFHNALCDSMSLARRAETTGNMLQRLRNAIDAELTTVQSVENRVEEARRVRTAVAVTFVTTVGGTLGLLFGFFGINATQVDGGRSIFDAHYLWIYLLIALLIASGLGLYAALGLHERRRGRPTRRKQQAQLSADRIVPGEAPIREPSDVVELEGPSAVGAVAELPTDEPT